MRRVSQHVAALSQSIHDKRQVKLLEVANAAMHELDASALSSFGEIKSLDQQSAIAAGDSFNRCAQAAGAAADHQHIPWLRLPAQLPQNLRSHGHTCNSLLASQPSQNEQKMGRSNLSYRKNLDLT